MAADELIRADELVKAVLAAENCELYDRVRIGNIFRNLALGFGKVTHNDETKICITYITGKNKKITYHIPRELINNEQISLIKS